MSKDSPTLKKAIKVISILALVLAVSALLVGGYYWNWTWTGFGETQQSTSRGISHQPAKSLWDWLDLIIVPATLAVGGLLFNRGEKRREQQQKEIQEQREEAERVKEQAERADREAHREALARESLFEQRLQMYFDRMSQLLLDHELQDADRDTSVQAIAQALTLRAFESVGNDRKKSIIKFLRDSLLINAESSIVRLSSVKLTQLKMRYVNLSQSDLRGLVLNDTDLHKSDFYKSNVSSGFLKRTNLHRAAFANATLVGTKFTDAIATNSDFSNASLIGADLRMAQLEGSSFTNANLAGANLSESNLSNVDLSGADLSGANLTNANLTNANFAGSYIFNTEFARARNTESVIGVPIIVTGHNIPRRLTELAADAKRG